MGGGQLRVDPPGHAVAAGSRRSAIGIDHRADPGGGGADHRQPFLDRAQPGLRQKLRWAPAAEPAVVGRVEEEVGPVGAVDNLAGKNDLIADLHPDLAALAIERQVEVRGPGPGQKSSRPAPAATRPMVRAASASADIRRKAPDAPCHNVPRISPLASIAINRIARADHFAVRVKFQPVPAGQQQVAGVHQPVASAAYPPRFRRAGTGRALRIAILEPPRYGRFGPKQQAGLVSRLGCFPRDGGN